MSECVVRMEMPGCCWGCPCIDDYGDYPRCRISNEQRGYNFQIHEKRMPRCPITQPLPEGHGRLIDADEFLKRAIGTKCFGEDDSRILEQLVGESITIVPAEAESPSPKPTDHVPKPTDPVPIRDVYYVMTECDAKTGTVKYEPRERSET